MGKHKRWARVVALCLSAAMALPLLPAASRAAGTTLAGEPVTVDLTQNFTRSTNLNAGWKFFLGNNPSASAVAFDDSGWETVDLPHDFSISQPFTTAGEAESGFLPGGTGWYRKSLVLPENLAGKTFLLILTACTATRRSISTASWWGSTTTAILPLPWTFLPA